MTIYIDATIATEPLGSLHGIYRVEHELIKSALSNDRYGFVAVSDGYIFTVAPSQIKNWVLFGVPVTVPIQISENRRVEIPEKLDLEIIHSGDFDSNPAAYEVFQSGDWLISAGMLYQRVSLNGLRKAKDLKGFKVGLLIHDLVPIVCPQWTYFPGVPNYMDYFSKIPWVIDKAFFYSRSTLNDYIQYVESRELPHCEHKLVRLGNSLNTLEGDLASPTQELDLPDRYFTIVSTLEIRKNHQIILSAYRLLLEKYSIDELPNLVFIGKIGWHVESLLHDIDMSRDWQKSNGDRAIKIYQGLSDREMIHAVENSIAALFPSLYEGWGLPVDEAIALGVPVIASNSSSITEIAPDLVEHVNPLDARMWAKKIELAMQETTRRRNAPRIHSWAEMSKQILEGLD